MKKSIEKIFPRPSKPGMVGDGFRVYNMVPVNGITKKRVSPFLLLDFNVEFDFGPSDHIRGVEIPTRLFRSNLADLIYKRGRLCFFCHLLNHC
ncbi:hypothetical protein [Sphingobacterium puteale]|uniref:hypothetical protein n=1 Tax=Sphingobacterium puteale TaxID=2420510 RepID=UPI003D95E7AA